MTGENEYMEEALSLAERGGGYVNPNPLVGAVVIKNDRIVGRGYHRKFGEAHAEVNAISEAGDEARDAELYVSLEPCIHHGKTPPCVDLILERGIKKVYVASLDPNPCVNGKGVEKLRSEGVEVRVGMMDEKNRDLNEIYFKYARTGLPFIQLKLAMSMDGKIATRSGDSKWISGVESRREVHKMRSRFSSILVGINTVVSDNPKLTVRRVEGPQPKRIILDPKGRIPESSNVLCDGMSETVVVTGEEVSGEEKFDRDGVCHWRFPLKDGEIPLSSLVGKLGKENLDSLLVEGGGEVAWSFVQDDLIDKFTFFYSPKLIGGKDAVTALGGSGYETVDGSLKLMDLSFRKTGEDLLFQAYPEKYK